MSRANRAPEFVTMGEALGLFLADGAEPITAARSFRREVAGAELNVAVGLARLGHSCRFVGRVGDDPFGWDVIATLRAAGVDTCAVSVDASASTGLIVRDFHGERRVEVVYSRTSSAGSRLCSDDLDPSLLAGAQILHVTGVTAALGGSAREAIERAVKIASDYGVAVSLDPNFRSLLWSAGQAREVMRPLAEKASIVLASEWEACWLSGCADRKAAASWFLDKGAKVAVVKCGAEGVWVADPETAAAIPAFPVRIPVDPVGAGDAFDAGFLSAWLRGLGGEGSARVGAAAGAACVLAAGDLAGLPDRKRLDALMAADGVQEVRR